MRQPHALKSSAPKHERQSRRSPPSDRKKPSVAVVWMKLV